MTNTRPYYAISRLEINRELVFSSSIIEAARGNSGLLHYAPSRKRRLFNKQRRIHHIVLPVVAILGVYGTLSLWTAPEAPATTVVAPQQTTAAAQAFNHLIPAAAHKETAQIPAQIQTTPDTATNLKSAFHTKPVAASYQYKAPVDSAAGNTLAKPAAAVETGINQLLERDTPQTSAQNALTQNTLPAVRRLTVGKGDTLMNLLTDNNVPRNEAYEAIEALRKVYDPRRLNPGHTITVFFHRDSDQQNTLFGGLQIEKDLVNSVIVSRDSAGDYRVDEKEKPVFQSLQKAAGRIDSSLYVSAKAQGLPDGVIIDLIRMYSWNVDFQRDIQSGDHFEVMYQQSATADGEIVTARSEIQYAKLTLSGSALPFYLFEDKKGVTDYFDSKGQSAKKSLMKTPIDGARLSSGYGLRKHPVLGYTKMHKGLDFAAPRGTPIYAAGDGTIARIGPFSSYGKYIRIRHSNGLETAYAHMKGFKSGLRHGHRVKQGDIIGYVGTTGRSTGPHLHYEILRNGKHVNPKTLKTPTGRKLSGDKLAAFQDQRAALDRSFKALNESIAIAGNSTANSQQASR